VKQEDLELLLDLYGVTEPHRSEVKALARKSHRAVRLETIGACLPEIHVEMGLGTPIVPDLMPNRGRPRTAARPCVRR
jgi:hypothetical protein